MYSVMAKKSTRTKFIILLCSCFGVFLNHGALAQLGTSSATSSSVSQPTPSASSPTVLWIDVRSEAEFAQGHLPGAILVPHDTIAAKIATLAPDKSQPIQLYCRSGRRSGIAAQVLKDMGYTAVTNAGGYEQLKQTWSSMPAAAEANQ
jgi:phage shock protein E